VPYDINFIWRTGNEGLPHDQLSPYSYSDQSHRRIDKYLERYSKGYSVLIEKTVSNTIRIPFLLRHYPHAKFIFLYRNGFDVCESVMRQWELPVDQRYLIDKLKHVPLRHVLSYGLKFVTRNIKRDKNNFFWGVNYPGLKEHLSNASREEIVAYQWRYCVGKMLEDKMTIPRRNLMEIRYEEFVDDPKGIINKTMMFLGMEQKSRQIDYRRIRKDNVGKSGTRLTSSQKKVIYPIIKDIMTNLKYTI
jgi:hypothetical protein